MVDNTWGNRHNFLNGGGSLSLHMASGKDSGQELVSKLIELGDKLHKMHAVRPSESVSVAIETIHNCRREIDRSLDNLNSNPLKSDAASAAEHIEMGRGPSLS